MIKKQVALVKREIISQTKIVFGIERRKNSFKRWFLDHLFPEFRDSDNKLKPGKEESYQQAMCYATRVISSLRELGKEAAWEVITDHHKIPPVDTSKLF